MNSVNLLSRITEQNASLDSMIDQGQIFIVSAPSGSGKTTLVKALLAKDQGLTFSISYTTRQPRGKEQDGVEYFFVSEATFQKMIFQNEFLEYAMVFGYFYGTTRRCVETNIAKGRDLLLDIDTKGAAQVRKQLSKAVSIFIMPPSYTALKQRLEKRRLDSSETIRRRLESASQEEICQFSNYDYVVINDDLTQSCDQIRCIVQAERCRLARSLHAIKLILKSFGGHSIDE